MTKKSIFSFLYVCLRFLIKVKIVDFVLVDSMAKKRISKCEASIGFRKGRLNLVHMSFPEYIHGKLDILA